MALFSWILFYEDLASRLMSWRSRQAELVELLDSLRSDDCPIAPLTDKDETGNEFLLREIDPFTVFALFNRGLTDENRRKVAKAVGSALGVSAAPPQDFAGIPVVLNQTTRFFAWATDRKPSDIPTLWDVFESARGDEPLSSIEFTQALDRAFTIKGIKFNITMGLFWIRPQMFASLDKVMRDYAGIPLSASELTAERYVNVVRQLESRGESFPQLSYDAWLAAREKPAEAIDKLAVDAQDSIADIDLEDVPTFWFVGAYWSDKDPKDQTARFVSQGTWENGWTDRFLEQVRSMRPGERIAIKSAYTRRKNLPFVTSGKAVAVMGIKAVGTIVANSGDGRSVSVNWDQVYETPREWYFYTNLETVWGIRRGHKPYNDFLIDFTFGGKQQNYDWFLHQPHWAKLITQDVPTAGVVSDDTEEKAEEDAVLTINAAEPYGVAEMMQEGVFLTAEDLKALLDLIRTRKDVILQGPPGVGKSFVAKKLALGVIGSRDESRVRRVQFHQAMSYEDFVRGLRPRIGKDGFDLVDGPFLEFCEEARVSPDEEPYVFIIEEINRGNPAGIFGELLTLIEADKRDVDNAIRLTHQRDGELPFYVPPNVHIIGTMNLADRSLANLDYALRRRFAFASLQPQFGDSYVAWCEKQGVSKLVAIEIARRVHEVNQMIQDDATLGPEYLIGHSYFCPRRAEMDGQPVGNWYKTVVTNEVVPLLGEYWFDNTKRVGEARDVLLSDPLD